MFFCPHCGKAAPENAACCPNCGAALAGKAAPSAATPSAPKSSVTFSNPAYNPAPANPKPTYSAPVHPNPTPTYSAPANPNPNPAYRAPANPNPNPAYRAPANPNPNPAYRAPAAPAYAAPAYAGYSGYAAPAKKSNKGLIIGIVAAVLVIAAVIGILFLTGVLGKPSIVGTWTGQLNLSQNMDLILAEAPSDIASLIKNTPGLTEVLKTAPAITVTYTFMEGGTYSSTIDMSSLLPWVKQNAATIVPPVIKAVLGDDYTIEQIEAMAGMSISELIDQRIKPSDLIQSSTGTYVVNGTSFTLDTGNNFGTFSRKEMTLNGKKDSGAVVPLTLTRSK